MIGYAGISYRGQERTEAEFYVSKPYRNHGYCTEALQKVCEEAFLGNLKWRNKEGKEVCPVIDKLYATTISANHAAVKVLEKCGFSKNTEIAFCLQVLIGTIVIVDVYGTLCDPTQVYYDIETQDGTWYKHVPESFVEKIEDIKAGRDVD
ncbi:MAG: GNAT family N-acetyltransferase [Roseburia sp.]|nr:GNAT family N-acetyltransferase [Roseburia sp.]